MERVTIEVINIRGNCPIFKVGDKMTIDGAQLVLSETDAFCIWAASSLIPYILAVKYGISSTEIGLSKEDGHYYVNCLDPGPPLTDGGTVTFALSKENNVQP